MDQLNDLIAKIHSMHPAVFLGSVFVLALVASPHCISMCGVFCLSATKEKRSYTIIYHLGRLLTYLVLGFLFSFIGEAIIKSFQPYVFIIVITTFFILLIFNSKILKDKFSPFQLFSKALFSKIKAASPKLQAFLIGLSSATLPCGLLYVFLFAAMSVQSAVLGTAMIFMFWLATLPALEALVVLKTRLSKFSIFQQNKLRYGLISFFFVYALSMTWHRIQMTQSSVNPHSHSEEQQSCH